MEYIKCPKCGGLVLKDSALMFECMVCERQYHTKDVNSYEPKTNYSSTTAGLVESAWNSGNDSAAVRAINNFLDGLPKDLVADGAYEIEHHFIILCQNKINDNGNEFADWPWNYTYGQRFINDCHKVTDFLYSVCSQTNGRISYEYLMSYASYIGYCRAQSGWNCEVNSRWKKYTQDDDALNELIKVGDVCIDAVSQFDVYGSMAFACVYEFIAFVQDQLCTTTYPHHYWIGDYYATQHIGLTESAKSIRRTKIRELESKAKAAKNKQTKIKNDIIAEERRIEAEKKAKRIEKFWKANPQLKKDLETEKKECQAKIVELTQERDAINANKEIKEIQEEIALVQSALAALGFFAFKQKKEKKATIAKLEREIDVLKQDVAAQKRAVQSKINIQTNRIAAIDNELTKDRPE